MSSASGKHLRSQIHACANVLGRVLPAVLQDGRPADRALNYVFKRDRKYGSRDRRLIAESVFSVFRWLGWLAELPGVESQLPLSVPDSGPSTSSLLRLLAGAWLLDGVDDPARISGAFVQLGLPDMLELDFDRLSCEEKFAKFAISLGGAANPFPLSRRKLLPEWTEEACRVDSDEWDRLLEWSQKRPPMYIRIQGGAENDSMVAEWLLGTGAKFDCLPAPFRSLRLRECPVNLYQSELFRAGAFELQDAASQVIGLVSAPTPGERWWDCCAGGGGKTLQIADLMNGYGCVLASDIRDYKLKDTRLRARRGGFSNVSCKQWKGTGPPAKPGSFDGVLVDAPCTCSGTWRRNPDGRWTTHPDDVEEMGNTQIEILERAKRGVRAGGILVYATCSMFAAENEDVVMAFLEKNADFRLVPFVHPFGDGLCGGMLRIWPWELDSDAMFVAKLECCG
jgi:16S rRNA (cytosine967-C5)-methyltransferase